MYALRVVFENRALWNIVGEADRRPFVMALAAKLWNVDRGRRGIPVRRPQNVMRAVTRGAGRGEFVTALGCAAVQALCVLGGCIGMTVSAVNLGKFISVRKFLRIYRRMAVRTFQGSMRRRP